MLNCMKCRMLLCWFLTAIMYMSTSSKRPIELIFFEKVDSKIFRCSMSWILDIFVHMFSHSDSYVGCIWFWCRHPYIANKIKMINFYCGYSLVIKYNIIQKIVQRSRITLTKKEIVYIKNINPVKLSCGWCVTSMM